MVRLHKRIPLFVTTFSGRVINFEVDTSDTITNILAKLQKKKEILPDKLCIHITRSPHTKPILPELLNFLCIDGRVIHLPVEIGTKHFQFGVLLLDDRTGARVKSMDQKNHHDAEKINTEILMEWLTGSGKQPVTWSTLVTVLHAIQLNELAHDIEVAKCIASRQETRI